MHFKVWLKNRVADRVLSPLRKELIELIDPCSAVFEVGCGTGDLLFRSASKIKSGYGVDLDPAMIEFAGNKKLERDLDHLTFECVDALQVRDKQFDIATSTLCLHEMPESKACDLLRLMVDRSKVVLIADYTAAKSTSSKIGIEFDELISGHYGNYKRYRRSGEIPSYAEKIDAVVELEIASEIDGISIWRISKRAASS
ncbi:MAG: class I SAM-dependent methyltransferase [Candidatus Thiodiazotropha taylori]|nr:class I SAM-dependent methyltransferase [Candidatus Thiodiazotropha taylori]